MLFVRGLVGAMLGGVIGYFVFRWLLQYGLYGLMIPGAALGFGAGLAARGRLPVLGIVCVVAAIGLGLFAEWSAFPFKKDPSFSYFVTHAHLLKAPTLLMIGLGGVFAYWFGQGR
jgi:hypothetical protein